MAAASSLPVATTRRDEVVAGLSRAAPLVLGYVPVGFTFGLLALSAGIAPANIMAMSLLVYAASSQILAVQLIAGGASPGAIVATTFIVNLRHLLMSSALARHLGHLRRPELALFAFQLTDETFAVHSDAFATRTPSRLETFVLNISLHLGWLVGTGSALVTRASPDILDRLGLDFAPLAMFIAVLVLIIKDGAHLAVALGCGTLAVGFATLSMGPWGIVVATVLSATAGLMWDQWTRRRSS